MRLNGGIKSTVMSHNLKQEYRVSDPARFSALVDAAVTREGNPMAAARSAVANGRAWKSLGQEAQLRVRAAQLKLKRYAAVGVTRITDDIRRLLLSIMLRPEAQELDDLLIPSHARLRMARYRQWMRHELRDSEMADDLPSRADMARARTQERRALWRYVCQHVPAAVDRLEQAITVDGATLASPRAEVSFSRVLDPLLSFGLSGGVERHWRELNKRELRAYFNSATRAEEILLRRSSDLERVTNRPTQTAEFLRPPWQVMRDRP